MSSRGLPLQSKLQQAAEIAVFGAFHKPYHSDSARGHVDSYQDMETPSTKLRFSFSDMSKTLVLRTHVEDRWLIDTDQPLYSLVSAAAHIIAWMNWRMYTEILCFVPPAKGSDQYELPLAGEPIRPLCLTLINTFESGVYNG